MNNSTEGVTMRISDGLVFYIRGLLFAKFVIIRTARVNTRRSVVIIESGLYNYELTIHNITYQQITDRNQIL